jgi:hypothetical protein
MLYTVTSRQCHTVLQIVVFVSRIVVGHSDFGSHCVELRDVRGGGKVGVLAGGVVARMRHERRSSTVCNRHSYMCM